jgi:hypothetical protein
MSSIISALDSGMENKRLGEKGHVEYDWGEKNEDLITQFFFQMVRTRDTSKLESILHHLLKKLKWENDDVLLTTLYKLIGQTRDIVKGKGEMDLTWMQLKVWYQYYPDLSYMAFLHCVIPHHTSLNGHQYGSWKDVKYFLYYLKINTSADEHHPLINIILEYIVVPYLKNDEILYNKGEKVSLIGRWLPREKSSKKFNWIFKKLAQIMYPEFLIEPSNGWKDKYQKSKAELKQKIFLKKLLVKLSGDNGGSDTPQVKMCCGEWSKLKFNMVPSITIRKQKNAICNITKKGKIRSNNLDRAQCAKNYKEHIKGCLAGDDTKKIHGKRLTVGDLTRDGYMHNDREDPDNTIRNTINLQWKSNSKNNLGLEDKPIIAMADTSGSMEVDNCLPLNNSIGLAIRISEICHPAFRHRIMTFDAIPQWINTENCKDFVDKAKKVKKAPWGCNTDFHLAIDKIIECLVSQDVEPSSVKHLVLAVFSDMQFDSSYHNINIFDSAYIIIKDKFIKAGMRTKWKTPYEAPHILFWNLRKTKGFPSTSYTKNISFLGGYNSTLLNIFVNKGINELKKATPFTMLEYLVNNSRYNALEDNISQYLAAV